MTVETVLTIGDLDPAYPEGGAPKSEGDDHIRNIKLGLRQSFAGFDGAVICAGADGGLVNSYTLTPTIAPPAYAENMLVVFTPTITNTGTSTIDVAGLGAKAITSVDGTPMLAGDLVAGRTVMAVYKGAGFKLVSVSQNYIEQLVVSRTLPGVNVLANAGKYFTTDGLTGFWKDITPLPGAKTHNIGLSGSTPKVINYADGEGQDIIANALFNLSATGFPANRIAGLLLRIYGGSVTGMTTTGITWLKFDGTKTTDFAQSGITLQFSAETLVALFSYGDGIIYGKAVV